ARERDQARARGREFLKKFYARHEREGWPEASAVEQQFTIKLGDVSVGGSIDRVDRLPGGGVALVDYKTGQRPARLERDQKRQLFVYQIAARQALNATPEVLVYYYFDDEAPEQFIGTDQDLAELTETIIATNESIHAERFDATPDPRVCARCEYRDICPFRK
ncbi:MAG: PD-(D/E)XK nuclease family protein, partial [bacterium]|nr:PD-(D/E)XK nuclease family protein [bacterium]